MYSSPKLFIFFRNIATALILATATFGAAGDVDTSFSSGVARGYLGLVAQSVVQPDGKIIIAGNFTVAGGKERLNIARLNSDGSLDETFTPPSIVADGTATAINSVVLQSDGKIIIGGQFSFSAPALRRGIARLNTDGSPDNAFNSNPSLDSLISVTDLKIYSDGRIAYLGLNNDLSNYVLTTLDTNGSVAVAINLRGSKVATQPDGKVLVATNTSTIRRYNQDLSVDGTFAEVSYIGTFIGDIAVQSDGKIIIGGNFTQVNASSHPNLVRVNSTGGIDPTFNSNNIGPDGSVGKIYLYSDGRVLIGGAFSNYNGNVRQNIVRISSDGLFDPSFAQTRPYIALSDLDVQTDGKILVSSASYNFSVYQTERLTATGTRDSAYKGWIGRYGSIYRILVQPDDKILIAGGLSRANDSLVAGFSRFLSDGTTDIQFAQNAYLGNDELHTLALQNDNKVIIGSSYYSSNPRRLNPDGTTNVVFTLGTDAMNDIGVQADGKLLFAGRSTSNSSNTKTLTRTNINGSVDNGFPGSADGEITRVVYLADTRILVAGNFTQINGMNRNRIARLFADGTVDTAFNADVNGEIYTVGLQTDGKIVIGGRFSLVNGESNRSYFARLNSDGSLDNTFTPSISATVNVVKIQADGRILISGDFDYVNGNRFYRIARVRQDGSTDFTFNAGLGGNSTIWDISQQSDGKIIVSGDFSKFNGFPALGIVRLLNPSPGQRTPFDFDGDGRADFTVFRPSQNYWYLFRSSDSQVTATSFGLAGDISVPADYDGDGKTDYAIFRPASGDWWYLSSSTGIANYIHWGQNGDIPRPADYDGDGRADLMVFRPGNFMWYLYRGAAPYTATQFGSPGDKQVNGDFDGDGKSDIAIFRPSTGNWWWKSSVDGIQKSVHWGQSGDVPAAADFDGDGITDFAVFRPGNGVWYVLNSYDFSYTIVQFGLREDKPVPADFDGDGKADIAVFRPSSGVWYLLRSTSGFGAIQFGASGDIPAPNAFVP